MDRVNPLFLAKSKRLGCKYNIQIKKEYWLGELVERWM